MRWMEENEESLRGRQAAWHKDVKDQVFADNEEITVKRIKEKVQNMRSSWKLARKLREQSGSGVKPEDNTPSFVAVLEKKCAFFWRLDVIWGPRPNVATTRLVDSTPSQQASDTPSQIEDNEVEVSGVQTAAVGSDDAPPKDRTRKARQDSGVTVSSSLGKRNKAERFLGEHSTLAEEQWYKLQRDLQRDKLEAEGHIQRELQRERLESERELQRARLESEERIARIHAETQAKQFQAFMDMMAMVSRRSAEQGGHGDEGT